MLKSSPIGEAGSIITFYSMNEGKLRAVARGVRKPSSKMVGNLEPFNRVAIALARPKAAGIDTITQAQVLESFVPLRANLDAVSKGIYLSELVDRFGTEGAANPALYGLLVDMLRALNEEPDRDLALRYFELRLLSYSGFMPELHKCVECRQDLSPGEHLFSPDLGGTLCLHCTPSGPRIMPLSLDALKILRFLNSTNLSELTKLKVKNEQQDEVQNLLSVLLSYWLDSEIRSKSFMEHLHNMDKSTVYM